MTLNELRDYVEEKSFQIKIRNNVIKIPNYRDYTIYLYKEKDKNFTIAWDVCYGEHWANQQDKVFQKIKKFVDTV